MPPLPLASFTGINSWVLASRPMLIVCWKSMPPEIVRTPGTCGGRARIDGHRIRVMDIVIPYERHGLSPDEIVLQLPSLRLSEVHAALAYYYDHTQEIENDIREDVQLANRLMAGSPSVIEEKLSATRQHAS